jgi:hypothetical protein
MLTLANNRHEYALIFKAWHPPMKLLHTTRFFVEADYQRYHTHVLDTYPRLLGMALTTQWAIGGRGDYDIVWVCGDLSRNEIHRYALMYPAIKGICLPRERTNRD